MPRIMYILAGAVGLLTLLVTVGLSADERDERWEMLLHTASGTEVFVVSEIDSMTFRSAQIPAVCCVGYGCLLRTEDACLQEGGVFHAEWTSCSPNPCPIPTEAVCCLVGEYCVVMTESFCASANGVWYPEWTSCLPNPCVNPGMIWIPAGNVRLGQTGIAEPVNDFYVAGFYIDRYEVSNAKYKDFIDAGGYTTEAWWNPVGWAWKVANSIALPKDWNSNAHHGGGIAGNEQFPVNGVSWFEADAYCRWAGGRLPTEAEWEKAAKGGCETHGDLGQCDASDTPTYPWGEGISGPQANYWGSGDPYEPSGQTTPVGYYDGSNHGGYQTINSPSPYGLYDGAGNVLEWCSTKHEVYPYNPSDGRENPPVSYSECCRIQRGGFCDGPANLQCAGRWDNNPDIRSAFVGFRCARTGS